MQSRVKARPNSETRFVERAPTVVKQEQERLENFASLVDRLRVQLGRLQVGSQTDNREPHCTRNGTKR